MELAERIDAKKIQTIQVTTEIIEDSGAALMNADVQIVERQ